MLSIPKKIEVLPYFQVETLPEPEHPKPVALQGLRVFFFLAGWLLPGLAAQIALRIFSRPRVRARHRRSDELLEAAQRFEIPYGKMKLKAYQWGQHGDTVLLVHGWESRGTALRHFVPALRQAGYKVVAFDAPAHGDSPGTHTDLVHYAGSVRAVMQYLGDVRHAITHSFGGSTTVFAISYLDPSLSLDKLVLIGVPASSRKVVADYLDMIGMPAPGRQRFGQIMQRKYQNLTFDEVDVESALAKARVQQVLVVHDKADQAVPFESAERIFEKHPHVSLLVTQGFGHYRLMRQPAVIERVVNFLTQPIAQA